MDREFWERNTSSRAQKAIDRIAAGSGLDRKAVNILFNTYFDEGEPHMPWMQDRATPAADLKYARDCGVMVEPRDLDHDGIVDRLLNSHAQVDQQQAANAFVLSLCNRRMELRSALGSYAVFLNMQPHSYVPCGRYCAVCGLTGEGRRTVDDGSSAFVRLKWAGSVHHSHPDYAGFDLATFARIRVPEPADADRVLLASVLDTVRALPPNAELTALQKSLTGLFRANKTERQLVLEILGYCGILQPTGRPSLHQQFVSFNDRENDEPQ